MLPRHAEETKVDAPGVLHHVMGRSVEGIALCQDDADRNDFLCRLASYENKGTLSIFWRNDFGCKSGSEFIQKNYGKSKSIVSCHRPSPQRCAAWRPGGTGFPTVAQRPRHASSRMTLKSLTLT